MSYPPPQFAPAALFTGTVLEVHDDWLLVEAPYETPTSRKWLPDGNQAPKKCLTFKAEIDRYYGRNWTQGFQAGGLVNEFQNYFAAHAGQALDVTATYQVGDSVMVKGQHALDETKFQHTFNPWGPPPRQVYVYKYWAIGRVAPTPAPPPPVP